MAEKRQYYLAAWLVAPLAAWPASAQTPAGRELVVRSPPATLTDEFAMLIGTVGLKTPVKVTAPVSLGDLVQKQCGVVQPAYIKAIQAANGDPGLDFSNKLVAGQELKLPPCPPPLQIGAVPTKVRLGDNFVSYWKASASSLPLGDVATPTSGTGGLSVVTPVEARPHTAADNILVSSILPIGLEVTEPNSVNFANLARALNGERLTSLNTITADDTVLVPTVLTMTYSLPLDEGVAASPSAEAQARDSASAATGGAAVEARQELRFYGSVAPKDCKSGYASFDEDYENYLFRLLAENRNAVGDNSFTPALVMVLDSGLYDQAGLPGHPQINLPISSAMPSGAMAPGAKPYWPLDFISERMHGTEVASLTIGGTPMADLLSAVDIRQKILPVNIFVSIAGLAAYEGVPFIHNGTVPDFTIERIARDVIMTHLGTVTAQVVNMSFGGPDEVTLIPPARIGPTSETLYVAAAGNDSLQLDDTDFYPARSGGRASSNVLTVASVDSDGQLSWFSNSSTKFVDIAAPGCRVPVLSYEKDPPGMLPAEGTGTSFSAPQVSWVASMISGAVGSADRTASSVKKRILASADILPELADKITDGRVLNPKKALSLTKDVVEMKGEGGVRLRRGLLANDARSPSVYCDPAPARSHSQLLKVVPRFDGRSRVDGQNWLYFGDQDGTVEAISCKSRAFELSFRDAAISDDTMKSDDITDIVFRWQGGL